MQHYYWPQPLYSEEALTGWNSRNSACDCHQYLKDSAGEALLSTLKSNSTALSRRAALQQPVQQINPAYTGINAFPQEYNQRQWPWASWNKKKQSILLQMWWGSRVAACIFTAHSRTAELLPMNQAPALKTMLMQNSCLPHLLENQLDEFAVRASSHCQQPLSPLMSVESLSSNISLFQLHCYLEHYPS